MSRFPHVPLTSLLLFAVFIFQFILRKKFNNAKIVITRRERGDERRWWRRQLGWERENDETKAFLRKAFYCFFNHKMGFSSSFKSHSSEKNNIFSSVGIFASRALMCVQSKIHVPLWSSCHRLSIIRRANAKRQLPYQQWCNQMMLQASYTTSLSWN